MNNYEAAESARKNSEFAAYKRLIAKYGVMMIVFYLNLTVGAIIIGTLFGISSLDFGNLDDGGYALVMICNETASYLIPFVAGWIIFDKEMAFVPHAGEYKRMHFETVLLFFGSIAAGSAGSYITTVVSKLIDSIFGTGVPVEAFSSIMPQNITQYIVFMVCICVVAPICEEILFRGFLLKPLRRYGDMTAAVVSALLFGLFHANFDQLAYAVFVGFFFSVIAIRSGSILPTIILHVINNLLIGFTNYMPQSFRETDLVKQISEVTSCVLLLMAAAGVVAIAVLIVKKVFALGTQSVYIATGTQFRLLVTNPVFLIGIAAMLTLFFI